MSESLRVLVVDDDPSTAKTLSDILRAKGHRVHMAHSGPVALARVEQAAFDCLVSDIRMPGMNGVDLYRAIKVHQPNLPTVLMTAYSADSLVGEGLEEGALAALTKPLDIEELLELLIHIRDQNRTALPTG